MVIWKGGDNHCFFSAFDQSGDLGCCGTFGYSRELGATIWHLYTARHCFATGSLFVSNLIYSFARLSVLWSRLERRVICAKRNYCSRKELIVCCWMAISSNTRCANQTKGRILFYLFSYLCFSLRDYAGNARNAGMLLRLSCLPTKEFLMPYFFFQLRDSRLFLSLQKKS